jgi:hypothetical protein
MQKRRVRHMSVSLHLEYPSTLAVRDLIKLLVRQGPKPAPSLTDNLDIPQSCRRMLQSDKPLTDLSFVHFA